MRVVFASFILVSHVLQLQAGEKSIASLRDFRDSELKSAGFRIQRPVTLRVRGLGGGAESGWMSRDDGMFASGWIINARTRVTVWEMTSGNTSDASDGDRSCDEKIRLQPGEYEAYFAAPTFAYSSWTNHFVVNVDHRRNPLFEKDEDGLWFLKGLWSDDIPEIFERRAKRWGLDLLIDDSEESSVGTFTPPAKQQNDVFEATGLGDNRIVRQGLKVLKPVAVDIYAVGEEREDNDLVDYGWLLNADSRETVWEMTTRNTHPAGGARKNIAYTGEVTLKPGDYVLYYITDDSHSMDDWNSFPPTDPYRWGVTLSVPDEAHRGEIKPYNYREIRNVIVAITKVGDSDYEEKGFTLKKDATVRVYAFGERGFGRRNLADYGYIMDARSRERVWSMDVDRCRHAGGASKNVFADESLTLPRGNYFVVYSSDDSHSYDDWNADPPFDTENYGITVMGAGPDFDPGIVGKFVESRQEGMIAQIIRVGNDRNESERFSLKRPTRVRIYAIGEGEKRSMYDYGWIENSDTKSVVWEMTYGMSFHAGGARKNRMVNTAVLLDAGDYVLHYVTDDSHAFGSWNMEPPEDQQYWGITLYEDNSDLPQAPPAPDTPAPPPTPPKP